MSNLDRQLLFWRLLSRSSPMLTDYAMAGLCGGGWKVPPEPPVPLQVWAEGLLSVAPHPATPYRMGSTAGVAARLHQPPSNGNKCCGRCVPQDGRCGQGQGQVLP